MADPDDPFATPSSWPSWQEFAGGDASGAGSSPGTDLATSPNVHHQPGNFDQGYRRWDSENRRWATTPETTSAGEQTRDGTKIHLAGGEQEGRLGAHGSAGGSWGSEDGAHASAAVEGYAGVEGRYGAGASIDGDGTIHARVGADGAVGVGARGQASVGYGDVSVNAEGEVHAGARGGVGAEATFGPDGAGLDVGLDGTIGASAKGSVTGGIDGAQAGVEAEAIAGLAFKAGVDAELSWEDGFSFEPEFGIALGLGFSVKPKIEINPRKLIEKLDVRWPWEDEPEEPPPDDSEGSSTGGGGELVGMDANEVRNLSQRLVTDADRIAELMLQLTHALGSAPWAGPEREQFLAEWSSTHRPGLDAAALSLRDAAQTARRNADTQETTSATL